MARMTMLHYVTEVSLPTALPHPDFPLREQGNLRVKHCLLTVCHLFIELSKYCFCLIPYIKEIYTVQMQSISNGECAFYGFFRYQRFSCVIVMRGWRLYPRDNPWVGL